MDRAQLEQLALEKISKMQTVPTSGIDRASLEQMALEKLSSQGMAQVNPDEEASLGFANRARYAIEPIQSNRKALLVQEYGQDNVMEDKSGNLFVNQDGQFLPVNKEGFSFADAADFAGATPEIAGGIVGAAAGVIGGGGVMSAPAAIGLGAAGGVVGSGIRQAASAALGTPQVASVGERATEAGLSGLFSGIGSGVGIVAKKGLERVKPGISQIISNLKGAGKEAVESTGETLTKTASSTVGKSNIALNGNATPEFFQDTAESVMSNVADQSGRDVVAAEKQYLTEIAKNQNIPYGPTYAQAAQGKSLIAEAKVMDMPLVGGKIRKQVDGQLKAIKDNIEGLTGRPINAQSTTHEVGLAAREATESVVKLTKNASKELYQAVEEIGANASINTHQLYRKFLREASKLKLVDNNGNPVKFSADLGMTREEFNHVQGAFIDGMSALKSAKSKAKDAFPGYNPLIFKMPFQDANAIRRTMKGTVKELGKVNPKAAMHLKDFSNGLDDTMEAILNKEHPKLGEIFSSANKTYRDYKVKQEIAEKYFKDNGSDEFFAKTLTSGTGKVKEMKTLVGDEMVMKVAMSDIADKIMVLNDHGIGRARSVMKVLRDKAPAYKEAIGERNYRNLMENLHFLDRTGQPLGVARASLYNIVGYTGKTIKSLGINLIGDAHTAATTIAESKGTTLTKSAGSKVFETSSKIIPSSAKGFANAGNILFDSNQRSASSYPGQKSLSMAEREKEIEKRKRAISGSKNAKN